MLLQKIKVFLHGKINIHSNFIIISKDESMLKTILIRTLISTSLFFSFIIPAVHANGTIEKKPDVGCGIITLYEKPPQTRDMHYATINIIDGVVVNEGSTSFTLSAGKHIIKVVEQIRENSITRRRGEAKNFHIIEFDVEANKKYALGSKYIRKNRSKFKTGEYWQPEVWKTKDIECKS